MNQPPPPLTQRPDTAPAATATQHEKWGTTGTRQEPSPVQRSKGLRQLTFILGGVAAVVLILQGVLSFVVPFSTRNNQTITPVAEAFTGLNVNVQSSDVTILSSGSGDPTVTAKSYREPLSSESDTWPTIEVRDGTLIVAEQHTMLSNFRWFGGGPYGKDIIIDLGSVSIEDVVISSASADIDLETDAPRVETTSTSGDVSITLLNEATEVRAVSVSGDIQIDARDDAKHVFAKSNSGDVLVDVSGTAAEVETRSNSGDLTVTLPGEVTNVRSHTVSGDTNLQLPALPFRVLTSSVSGDVLVEITDSPSSRRTVDAGSVSGDIIISSMR